MANLHNKGLHTYKNVYSQVPEGSMSKASNVVIDRDDVVEPRRGLKQYGNALSNSAYRALQLFDYKTRLLRHTSNNKLQYDSNGSGLFVDYPGTFFTPETGYRIRSVEQNGNLYFLTSEGVKKISASSSDTLGSSDIITAGGVKALSMTVVADYTSIGFLEPQKQCAYKILWGYKDDNENLILGVPSERIIVQNLKLTDPSGNSNANTKITSNIPSQILNYPTNIKSKYFYQIYRTIQTGIDIDPGEEFNLVFEDFPTNAELLAGQITNISDITPDDIRVSGTLLYINPTSGEGIAQSNEAPPFAKDITTYKGYTFYGNTSTVQRLFLDYLSVEGISANDELKITNGISTRTYAFQGEIETYTLDYSACSKSNFHNSVSGPAKYFTIDAATISNVAAERSYYLWFYNSANDLDPAIVGKLGIKVDISTTTATDDIAEKIKDTLEGVNGTIDFNTTVNLAADTIQIATANNGYVQATPTTTVTNLSIVKSGTGLGEDSSTYKIFLPRKPLVSDIYGPSTSQQLEQVAQSTINVINDDSAAFIYGFYQSGPETTPGKMLFEQRTPTGSAFWFYTTDGFEDQFTPTIGDTATTKTALSTNEVRANRIYYSKYQQPEAVPLSNYFDVGPRDKRIQRIVSLRDALFVFKEEGVYRITGDTAPFVIQEFDSSVYIRSIDSVAVLNNQIYALTSQGVVAVTDTGVQVISRGIEDIFSKITHTGQSFKTATFGVAYETDRAYLLFTISNSSDTVATTCYRYNTFTSTWTTFDVSAICGIVKFGDDKLYIGAADIPYIEQERKNLDITDYCDREYELSLGDNSVTDNVIILSSSENVKPGDAISQVQYLTNAQYNRVLRKLDMDSQVSDSNYEATLQAIPGSNLRNSIVNLANKLDADPGVADTDYFTKINTISLVGASIATGSGIVTVTSNNHGILNNRYVTFSSSTTTPSLNGLTFKVSNATTNTFDIETTVTVSGTANVITAIADFRDIQSCFNIIVDKLNNDINIFYSNYPSSEGTTEYRGIVSTLKQEGIAIYSTISTTTLVTPQPFIVGPVTLYKAIESIVQYNPVFSGDPSTQKQFSEGTFRFESNNFSNITISYATDLSPSFEEQEFTDIGTGEWGDSTYGESNWGGIQAPVPIRTLIPLQKQRATFIIPKFRHKVAIQKYAMLYTSINARPYSTRAYKGK